MRLGLGEAEAAWGGMPAAAPVAAAPPILVAGVPFEPTPAGALWWAEERLLAVADLHFDKGAAFARRGQHVPPYDTRETLAVLARLVQRFAPRTVIALGDSFHDGRFAADLAAEDRETLTVLQRGRDWIWIEGNHDADLPPAVGGTRAALVAVGPITFVHEPRPGSAAGEVAGHLHPAARVWGRGGSVRRRCFAGDGTRLVMPAVGAFTGGLNVLDPAFAPLFGDSLVVHVLSGDAVYRVERPRLCPG